MSTTAHKIYFAAGILLLLPFFILALYTVPCADDWCAQVFLQHFPDKSSAFRALFEQYNGRFSANGILLYSPLNHQQSGYSSWILAQLVVFVVVFVLVLRQALEYFGIKKQTTLIALFSLLASIAVLPQISEALFWLTGSTAYLGGSIFLLLHAGSILFYLNKPGTARLMAVILIAFLAQGWNEVQTFFLAGIYLFFALYQIIKKQALSPWFVFSAIAVLSGALLLFLAPGNEVRMNNYTEAWNIENSLMMSLAQVIRFLSQWMFHPAGIALALVVMSFGAHAEQHHRLPSLLVLSGILLFSVFMAAFLPYLTTGILGQHRSMNWSCTLCFFLLPLIWFQIGNRFSGRFQLIRMNGILPLFLITVSFTGNFFTAGKDLFSGEASAYFNEQQNRFRSIQNGSFKDQFSIPKLQHRPKSISAYDVAGAGDQWIRDCMWEAAHLR